MFQSDLLQSAKEWAVDHDGKVDKGVAVLCTLVNHAIPINIQPVSDYLYTGTDQEDWYLDKDFPNLAPPWELYWAHWYPSSWTRSNGQVIQREGMSTFEYGCLCVSMEVEKYRERIIDPTRGPLDNPNIKWSEDVDTTTKRLPTAPPEAKWLTCYYLFGRNRANNHTAYWSLKFFVDKQGVGLYEKGGLHAGPPHNWPTGQEEIWTKTQMISPSSVFKDVEMKLENEIVGSLFPLFLAISFCHCRNVEVKDIPVPPKVIQKRERKGIWTPKIRREIHIEPMRKLLRATPGTSPHDLKRQLVIRRGHFKDFKEGRGLFGKHHGLYWWDNWVKDSSNVKYQIEGMKTP